MKKKAVFAALAAALVLSQNTMTYAAGSSSSDSEIIQEEKVEMSNGNSRFGSNAMTDDTYATFVEGEKDAVAGLKKENADQIQAMNSGADLSKLGMGLDLTGYKTLNKSKAIMTYKKGTRIEKTGNVTLTLYIPNLIKDLGNVQILFFNNMRGKWELIKPDVVNEAKKRVTITIPNSGTVSVIYKK